jgi:hypothetical protein
MFGELLGGLIDKEKATRETITSTLEDLSEELGAEYKDFFVTIQPTDEKFVFKLYLYHVVEGRPKFVREVPLKEVTG